jgi:hypothetical protein
MSQRDTGIAIADVLYTNSDETFYVLNRYDHESTYEGGRLEDVADRLEQTAGLVAVMSRGWTVSPWPCGVGDQITSLFETARCSPAETLLKVTSLAPWRESNQL